MTPAERPPARVASPPRSSGVLVVDKARGPTSHDAVARVRRTLGVREVGHAGTLDPMATGALVLAVGEATKLVPWLTAQPKAYTATVALGVETDTLDADGRETRRAPPSDAVWEALARYLDATGPAPARLAAALDVERARVRQTPPAFSAIRRDGERAYARARRGEEVALEARDVEVLRLEVVSCAVEPPALTVSLEVSKGYYVRALARDLAAALGTVGHLTSLRRTRSGAFDAEGAPSADAARDELLSRLEPLSRAAVRALPAASLSEAGARDARHGRRVLPGDLLAAGPGPSAWLDPQGRLVAVGHVDDGGGGTVLRGFRDGD